MLHVKGKTQRDKENAAIRILKHSLLKEIHIIMWLTFISFTYNWHSLASAVNKRTVDQILTLCVCICVTHRQRKLFYLGK